MGPIDANILPIAEPVLLRTATINLIVLIMSRPWTLGRLACRRTWSHQGIAVSLFIALAATWLLFLVSRQGMWESLVMYLYLPAIASLMIICNAVANKKDFIRQSVSSDEFSG